MPAFDEYLETLRPGSLAVVGVPFDAYSSFQRGAAGAPPRIWEAFHCDSANTFAENGIDIARQDRIRNLGQLPFDDYLGISDGLERILARGARVLSLGGDHSISYPLLRAYSRHYPELTILQLDAHSDLYDIFEGNRYSHACPFARIMEEGLAARLVQVGVRTLSSHQREQAARFGVEIHELRHGLPEKLELRGPVYLTLDLDVLDPAFAPGVSHHEPGGISVRELLKLLHRIEAPIVGADLVEYNPRRDLQDMTAMVAAKLMREILAKMLESLQA